MSNHDAAEGKYFYAVIAADNDFEYGKIGIDGQSVYMLQSGPLAAVVSDFNGTKIRPERRHIAAHQAVLKTLMARQTPLPITFGVIAESTRAIGDILSSNRKVFLEQLSRVNDKVEMGLRVSWDVPNIFEYFVSTYPELRAARDRLVGSQRAATQEEKIEVGRLFEQLLADAREQHSAKVRSVLTSSCSEIKLGTPRNEREVMNMACLVARADVSTVFEAKVFEAANLFDNNFIFDFNGPWAPHNFVDLKLGM